jgi:zinc transporter
VTVAAPDDSPGLLSPFQPGVVWSCWEDPDADRVETGDYAPPAEARFRWLHLDLWDRRSVDWVTREGDLPQALRAMFLSSDEQPRAMVERGALALVLPDFQREFDREETEQLGALHLAIRHGLVLTGRHRPIHTPDIIRHRAMAAGRLDAAAALELVLSSLADTLAIRTASSMAELVAVEDQLLADEEAPDTRALVALRRMTARLHRMARGMHMALFRAAEDPAIDPAWAEALRRAIVRLQAIERDVVAAQGQLRLLREELDLQSGQRTNENVYLLSVITALIMPATLVTSVFGMNTGGLPLAHGAGGTFMATVLAAGSSLATWLLLRRMGLVRR